MTWGVAFDLDDTLCDTMGQLVMAAHREAAHAMSEAGLDHSVETILAMRMEVWEEDGRADIDTGTSLRLGGGEAEAEAGRRAYLDRRVGSLEALPGTEEVLSALEAGGWKIALVTRGMAGTQLEKIRLLGFSERFDPILVVPSDTSKEGAYRAVMESWGIPPERAVAVGDRPDKDIAPAKRLGMRTVRILRGEHVQMDPRVPLERADAQIAMIEELPAVLEAWRATG